MAEATEPKSEFRWTKDLELGYEEGRFEDIVCEEPVCFHCGKSASEAASKKLSRCSKCNTVSYCSRECQVTNWKGGDGVVGHKYCCAAYKRVGEDNAIVYSEDKDTAKQDILSRIRFYSMPYAVTKQEIAGPGFLFLQSDASLATMSLPSPKLSNGRVYPKQRSILLHWLTMEEFSKELAMEDFELASVKKELKEAVEDHDSKSEVPVLMRFRCGHVSLGIVPLVPDFNLCKCLGEQYFGNGEASGALQLNIDDV